MKTILFTGGGSAGHVIPNLSLIEDILSAGDIDVWYMGTDGIEKRLVADCKIPFYQIQCPKLIRGGGMRALKTNLAIPFQLQKSKKQARIGLQKIRPDLVFSKGGYVALPVVSAAKKLGIPCLSHESDLSAGLANRLLVKKCVKIFTSFPETAKKFPNGVYSGAPIRQNIFGVNKKEAKKHLRLPQDSKVLLIFGGGSGSQRINESVRKHLKTLTDAYYVLHVCGRENVVESNFKKYRQYEFIADMGMAYAAADLVVSRAGAGALFEILALKKPALLIPLEGQSRGDQLENANYFQNQGLCRVLRQNDLENLPAALKILEQDLSLKNRLKESDFHSGNQIILQEIYRILNK